KLLPDLYETEEIATEDKQVVCKFFNPCGAQTWYIVEGKPITSDDGESVEVVGLDQPDYIFFCYVDGFSFPEWGYITLGELVQIRNPLYGLPIERDIYFNPCKFKEIQ
ncbi:unnamed protein product, partial [marine sediment metagenome]